MLPRASGGLLRPHLGRVKLLYDEDRAAGVPGVYLPDAIGRKNPGAGEQ